MMAPVYVWDPEPSTPRAPQRPSLMERIGAAILEIFEAGLVPSTVR